jgi:hypothetical protein
MFGSTFLDIAIGVTFIYLFLSLIGTAITEAIASFMNMRAKNLEDGIRGLLSDPAGSGLTKKFYDHPLLKALAKGKRKPSYIPSGTFARALLDTLVPVSNGVKPAAFSAVRGGIDKLPDSELKKTLLLHIGGAGNSLDAARENIEKWFDEGMDRIGGWYKRKSQLIVYIFAGLITLALNVDTIHLTAALYRDAGMRAGLVAAAEGAARQGSDDPERFQIIQSEMASLKLPMGWSVFSKSEDIGLWDAAKSIWSELPRTALQWLVKLCGWLITLFAISLGAPFWFDTLSKFVNVRATGQKPKTN